MTNDWDGKNRRNHWRRMKIKHKFPLLVATPVLLVMIIVSALSFFSARSSLIEQRDTAFRELLNDKSIRLHDWLASIETDIHVLAAGTATMEAIVGFTDAWQAFDGNAQQTLQQLYITDNPFPTGEKNQLMQADDGSAWSEIHGTYHEGFHTFQSERAYYDLFLFDLEGNLIYSVFKEMDFATNLLEGEYASSGLGSVFREARNLPQGEISVTDFAPYLPSFGAPAKFIGSPVFDNEGQRIGVAALQLPADQVATIISESPLLGETGQIYAVGTDGKARSGSLREGGHALLDQMPQLPQIVAAMNGEDTFMEGVEGLNGHRVLVYTHALDFLGTDWRMILEDDMKEANTAINNLLVLAIFQALVMLVIIAGLAYMVANTLTRRVIAIAESVKGISAGDFTSTVAETKTGDELGDIARVLERLKTELAAGNDAIAEREKSAEVQQWMIETVSKALANLASGALDCQINETFPQDYEKLRTNFNETVAGLSDIVVNLQFTSELINVDAQKLSEGTNDLSRRTENQAATLEETAAAMEQINASVSSTANGARGIVSAVDTTRMQAEKGEEVRRRAVDAMKVIEQSSEQIGNIVQLIDDIAFQTNLLSLNAGVEAARAGDAGRGFAVVASEVRALAQRSSQSAAEIRSLIVESNDNITYGVTLVSDMGSAIEEVLRGVSEVSKHIRDIASGAEEQATGLSEINTGILMLDKVTQQNAAMVEQSAASSRILQQKSDEMRGLVSNFRGARSKELRHEIVQSSDAPIQLARSA